VTVIASGFVIRLLVGSAVTGVVLSHWIIVMTFLLALFLALAKRRDDVLILLQTGQKTRKAIDGYNLKFLDSAMVMTASIVVLAYILWSISPEVAVRLGSENLYLSSVFVVLGVMRYMQIAYVEEKSGNPSMVLLRDHFRQRVLLGWLGVLAWILYLSDQLVRPYS
jgi:decaprenyl-phosphate phosphoribosyltransferase